ncbi:MAG: hypothetical protein COB23_00580 [Methylophaga sp.]|nr:MAG: hypothetical protein COB23_00580 [Methylophaga sp.]
MDKSNPLRLTDIQGFLIAILMTIASQAPAAEALAATIDCSDVAIHYVDNPEWTQTERLEAMDKAFFESVDRFELCNLSNQSNSASTSGANQVSGAANGSEVGLDSVASPTLSGTESEPTLPPIDFAENSGQPEDATNESVTVNGSGSTNGTIPKDIPAADNDDVIAAQIRLAAEIEKDPVKKEKLWNEYRKYKGIPVNDNE